MPDDAATSGGEPVVDSPDQADVVYLRPVQPPAQVERIRVAPDKIGERWLVSGFDQF
jgi:hypothetical protein